MNIRIKIFVLLLLALFSVSETFSQDPDFYFYPTPSELFDVIDKEELSFNKYILNPIENEQNYILSTTKYLNLGVYISDLAYSAFFSKQAKSLEYLKTITNLSNELLISSDLKENFNAKILSNANNMDSVYEITNNFYYDVMMELDKNNSKNALYIITTGAYVEAYNIALNLTEEYYEGNVLLEEIAKQKASLINLNKFSKLCNGDDSFQEVLKYQKEVIDIFNKFLIEEGTKRSFIRTEDGGIKFIGGPKITMNKEQFIELKSTIGKIRNEIIN